MDDNKMEGDFITRDTLDYEKSEIRKFFAGQTILLTGATGYLGKLIVEKLLRSCPEVEKIFVLIRPNRGLSITEIFKKTYSNIVFDVLRKQSPNFEEKIIAIEGDLAKKDLGLSIVDQRTIERDVNIILHTGATTKLDEKISLALHINVLATKTLLEIAKNCKNLKIFMYMSTAYSNCHRQHIEEKFYSSPADMKMVEDIILADTENEVGVTDEAMEVLRGEWINNYVFSKSVAEDLVRQYGQTAKFACGVYRPSIVFPTYQEPVMGWSGNGNGPLLIISCSILGIVHTCHYAGHPLDLIPADMCTNAYLASTWDTYERQKQNQQETNQQQATMYNYGSSVENPVTFDLLRSEIYKAGYDAPPSRLIWVPFTILCPYFWQFIILHILFHGIPAVLADIAFLIFKRQKPMLTPLFWKATKHSRKMSYFLNGNWKIHINETLKMCDRMNSVDKDLFYCDFRNFQWRRYFPNFYYGIRTMFLKDPIETAEWTNKTKFLYLGAHHIACALVNYLCVKYIISLLMWIFGL